MRRGTERCLASLPHRTQSVVHDSSFFLSPSRAPKVFRANPPNKSSEQQGQSLCCPLWLDRDDLATSAKRRFLHLRHAAIYEQLDAVDERAFIGGKEDHGPGDLVGCAHPAQGNACGLRSDKAL